MKDMLAAKGVAINPAGPGQHVPCIERKIQTVKNRCRGIINSLPFNIPSQFIYWLLAFVVFGVPSKYNIPPVSSREPLTGRKLDYDKDCRIQFGEYVHTKAQGEPSNSMSSRTEPCIALCPVGNLSGSIYVYNLETKRVLMRDRWISLPIPEAVIKSLNVLAQSSNSTNDLTFTIGSLIIEDELMKEVYNPNI
jgi:hypothetical protein